MHFESITEAGLRGVMQTPPDDCWSLERLEPIDLLKPYVSWVWIVTWNMADRVHKQSTLPYPTANLVIEDEQCLLYGPTTKTFEKELTGKGYAVGIKCKPGGVTILIDQPVTETVDRAIPAGKIFKESCLLEKLEKPENTDLHTIANDMQLLVASELPDLVDPNIGVVTEAFEYIRQDSQITKVDQLAGCLHLSRRSLQRLFTNYVGLGVKAVIRRYRLQEVAERVLSEQHGDWAALANKLGYYDQSHLIAECRNTFGVSPTKLNGNVY